MLFIHFKPVHPRLVILVHGKSNLPCIIGYSAVLPDLLVAIIKNQPELFRWKVSYLKTKPESFLPANQKTDAHE